MTLRDKAQLHVELSTRFGIQARQELSPQEVTLICVEYLDLYGRVADAEAARDEAVRQRDSANGKLSALQRKYDKLLQERS